MHTLSRKLNLVLALAVGGALVAVPALAEKPSWAESGKGGKQEQKERHEGTPGNKSSHFDDRQRAEVREYYDGEYRGSRCPPGLAKKKNGCMPPGQAKKWKLGQPLPRDVTYYPVPQALVVQIGPPPSGHRYVRVAGDILLIAVGTAMVVDAIQDLGR
jgi:Ni/Co efflux regulator RcnB